MFAALWLLFAMPCAARPLVAVIDSGVAATPELKAVLVGEQDLAASPQRPRFTPQQDHGTMIATIIAREAKGAVDIVSLRIDDPAGCPAGATPPCQPSAEPIAMAIRTAIALRVDAINISLTLKDDPSIVAAVADAARAGILIVLAAGNEGRAYPGNLNMALAAGERAILVGALDADGRHWLGSNRPGQGQSAYHYVWQRGVDVPGSLADGTPATGTGTSFAAPIETARRMLTIAVKQTGHSAPQLSH